VVEAIARELEVIISIDTSAPVVMTETIRLGAGLINDVRALQRPGALAAVRDLPVALCLMHMRGEPQTMQQAPQYGSVLDDVAAFLAARVSALNAAGIASSRILLDPGFGFGKTLAHNYQLLAELARLRALGLPLLVGVSRKSMIGAVVERPPEARLAGSLAAAALALERGASIIRAHDVAETVDVVRVVQALRTITIEASLE
jgi:dihydropteroate synthase